MRGVKTKCARHEYEERCQRETDADIRKSDNRTQECWRGFYSKVMLYKDKGRRG